MITCMNKYSKGEEREKLRNVVSPEGDFLITMGRAWGSLFSVEGTMVGSFPGIGLGMLPSSPCPKQDCGLVHMVVVSPAMH